MDRLVSRSDATAFLLPIANELGDGELMASYVMNRSDRNVTQRRRGLEAGYRTSAWILNSWFDLLLFVATPVAILPALILAQRQFNASQISLFVASFGAVGHHLPGMMRAYGDRNLFGRFKYRFIVAPTLIVATCILFQVRQVNGLVLVTYIWGVWHGLMQTYGFVRIYDAKAGSNSRQTSWCDRAMCIAWFGLAVLSSPTRMFSIFSSYYASANPSIPPEAVNQVTVAWTIGTAVVTLFFASNMLVSYRRGDKINPIKILLMGSSFAFWWYTNVIVSNMLVGIAMFEIFHDVQYLTIVWTFNLNRVDSNATVGRFTKFLFRRSGALAGVYVGLAMAYGSLNFMPGHLMNRTVSRTLAGVLVASALLHFYYDGFIWKVRERETREPLGLKSTRLPTATNGSSGWRHGLKWAPLVALAIWSGVVGQPTTTDLDRRLLIVASVPNSAQAHNNVGVSLVMNRHVTDGIAHLERALELDSHNAEAHSNLGLALAREGDIERAVAQYREALTLDPHQIETYSNLGNLLIRTKNFDEAIRLYQDALHIDPSDCQARTNLGVALLSKGRLDDAISQFEEVLRAQPSFEPAKKDLQIAVAQRVGP